MDYSRFIPIADDLAVFKIKLTKLTCLHDYRRFCRIVIDSTVVVGIFANLYNFQLRSTVVCVITNDFGRLP